MNAATIITALRERSGMTRKEFAEKIGVAYSLLWNWENGKVCPTTDNFVRIVHAADHEIVIKKKYGKEK